MTGSRSPPRCLQNLVRRDNLGLEEVGRGWGCSVPQLLDGVAPGGLKLTLVAIPWGVLGWKHAHCPVWGVWGVVVVSGGQRVTGGKEWGVLGWVILWAPWHERGVGLPGTRRLCRGLSTM